MKPPAQVLVVDDEPGTLRVLGAVLEDEGYAVETASSGRAALERIEASPRDLVLLDFLMPQLDGADTLRAIRRAPRGDGVRVVMMSGVAESIVRRRCRGAYEAFLRKPFGLDELLGAVRAAGRSTPKRSRKR